MAPSIEVSPWAWKVTFASPPGQVGGRSSWACLTSISSEASGNSPIDSKSIASPSNLCPTAKSWSMSVSSRAELSHCVASITGCLKNLNALAQVPNCEETPSYPWRSQRKHMSQPSRNVKTMETKCSTKCKLKWQNLPHWGRDEPRVIWVATATCPRCWALIGAPQANLRWQNFIVGDYSAWM